jgi:hypothetical protein
MKAWDELEEVERKRGNLFLVGTFDSNMISWTNEEYVGMGLYYHYDGEYLNFYSPYDGEVIRQEESCGIITSAKNPWNPLGVWNGMNLCWFVSGVTEEDVSEAMDLLVSDPQILRDKFGGVGTANGEVFEVWCG